MPKKRSWTDEQLIEAVASSKSYRSVLLKLKLIPAGGNYEQIKSRIITLGLQTDHFTGSCWNKGLRYAVSTTPPVESLLIRKGRTQSYKLKRKLFLAGLKEPRCEVCDWAAVSADGRIPVELDHINGDRYDNRLENLRILCPNCHSLQLTHRGKIRRFICAGDGIGRHPTLKMSCPKGVRVRVPPRAPT